jgi:hypothetical protein
MTRTPLLSSTARLFVVLALAITAVAVSAQSATPAGPQQVTLSLDRDLVTFVKVATWAAGIFLAIFATLAVGFFGFDVRAARKSLLEANEDIRTRMDAIRKDHQSLVELKERLGKLGAELIEQVEKKAPTTAPPDAVPPQNDESRPTPSSDPLADLELKRQKQTFIRKLLAAAEFEWSTANTIARRMGLRREEVIALAEDDPLVQQGTGRNSEVLFRLKHFNHLPEVGRDISVGDEWPDIVAHHLKHSRSPVSSKILGGQ